MIFRTGAVLFFVTTIVGTLVLITGCEQELLTPAGENASAQASRLKSDSVSVPPRDSVRKDTAVSVLPPNTSHIPADTIRKDPLRPRPKPFPIDSLVPKPPKDSIRTDTVKRKR